VSRNTTRKTGLINDTMDASQGDHDIHSYTKKQCSP